MTNEKSPKGEISFRNNSLRKLQEILYPFIPAFLNYTWHSGILNGTNIDNILKKREEVTADDITLSQLQLISQVCGKLKDRIYSPVQIVKMFGLATILDGVDGPVARKNGKVKASKEGGIKDAAVDRLSELILVRVIAEQLGFSTGERQDLETSFVLSTLTKAACEMSEVKTSEGGAGSMLERRATLLKTLFVLNRSMKKSGESLPEKKVARLKKDLISLMGKSMTRAKERIKLISQVKNEVTAPLDPESPGALEARKYAAIIDMVDKLGVNVLKMLNDLAQKEGVYFPSAQELIEKNEYIQDSINKVNPFIEEALSIAQPFL